MSEFKEPISDNPASQKQKEGAETEPQEIQSIPEELTEGVLIFNKKGEENVPLNKKHLVAGILQNPPIQVGEPIRAGVTNTSEVKKIRKEGAIFVITTKSGSEYTFDPSESLKKPDYLKNLKK
jgi:hypothetical protein